jgi:uncharacterized membrane protein YgdD (TMEM256/DUF423 family)
MTRANLWLMLGAIMAGLSVGAGAFGAHVLDPYLHEKYEKEPYTTTVKINGREKAISQMSLAQKLLADFKTGAEYQMYHSLALLAVGILAHLRPSRGLSVAAWCFLLGCFGFSGGLYAYALTDVKWFGMTFVPLGGVLFLVGWASLAISLVKNPRERHVDEIR